MQNPSPIAVNLTRAASCNRSSPWRTAFSAWKSLASATYRSTIRMRNPIRPYPGSPFVIESKPPTRYYLRRRNTIARFLGTQECDRLRFPAIRKQRLGGAVRLFALDGEFVNASTKQFLIGFLTAFESWIRRQTAIIHSL